MEELIERTVLGRLIRQATQYARLRTMHPLVGYVAAGMRIWVQNGLVTTEQARKFEENLLAAAMELALAPLQETRDHAGSAAKAASNPRARSRGPRGG